MRPIVIAGNENRIKTEVTSVAQQKSGMRLNVMPGARMLRIVTMKFSPPAIEAIPRIERPRIQKSVPDPL